MNINNLISRRKLGFAERIEIDFAVDQIKLKEVLKLAPDTDGENGLLEMKSHGPLAVTKLQNNVVAIANEDGYVNLMKSDKLKGLAHWLAHENAIFDIKSLPDNKSIITASGDATIKQWDVETKRVINSVDGAHHSSIKSVSVYDSRTIASGSRDGSIQVHDFRSKAPTMIVIRDAHKNNMVSHRPRKAAAKTDPTSTVTNVTFDPNFPRIYSTGANDATIKLWDLRKRTQTIKRKLNGAFCMNTPAIEVDHPNKGKEHRGYSHLILSNYKVYAACSDHKIYCYQNFGFDEEPIKYIGCSYEAHLKLAVMDDRFLFSGSERGGAMMWKISGSNCNSSKYYPETTKYPIGHLKIDDSNDFDTSVVETDWDSLSIMTFRDDRLVCKWTMQHVLDSERKKLQSEISINTANQEDQDLTIEMSDIIDVNVLRPNYRITSEPNVIQQLQSSSLRNNQQISQALLGLP